MSRFGSWSVRTKLVAIALLTSVGAMLFVASAGAWRSRSHLQEAAVRQCSLLAQVVGANCSAALTFHDRKVADETLAALASDPEVISADLCGRDGRPFARYVRAGETVRPLPPDPGPAGFRIEDGQIVVVASPIVLDGQRVGDLRIRRSLADVHAQVGRLAQELGLGIVGAALVAILLARRLAQRVSAPLETLSRAVDAVTRDKSYRVRVPPHPDADEMGVLVKAFNEMIAAVEERDQRLLADSRLLESQVVERTRDLDEARQRAEQASRMKSEFLANMSHEIRTPLNGVLGVATLLADLPMPSEQKRMVDTIRTSGDLLLGILNDVLDLSKIEAGRLELASGPFDLSKGIEEVLQLSRGQAGERGLTLQMEYAPDAPSWLIGDAQRVRQVLMNLVGNAVKFTPRGSVTVRVQGGAEAGMGRVTVRVVDTGIGISDEVSQRLFMPFTQGDGSTTRRFGGTGLGLAISRRLVELMGGSIGVDSAPGAGSEFWFSLSLPVARPEDMPASATAAVPQLDMLVLLAEDNAVNQMVAVRLLKKLGCRTVVVPDGRQAVDRVTQEPFDVVLMDCMMPELDGYEASQAIRAMPGAIATIPIIAMTASAMASDELRCREAGMTGFVPKPVRLEQLADALLESKKPRG